MSFKLNFNPTETTDKVDRPVYPADGWHKATLADVTTSDDGHLELQFEVSHGDYKGCKLTEILKNPDMLHSDKDLENAHKKGKLFAVRLGAITDAEIAAGGSDPDFIRCINRPFVIEVETRKFVGKDGADKKFTGLTYAGIYPPDHDRIPEKVRKELALPPARKKGAAVAAAGAGVTAGSNGAPPADLGL